MKLEAETLLKYGIPPRFQDADLAKALLRVAEPGKVDRFIRGDLQGLFIPGMNGCGKTYLSCAIMKTMMESRIHCFRSDAIQLVSSYTEGSAWEIPTKYLQPKVLVLDEVAKELTSSTARLVLEVLITWRGENEKQTILVSNIGLAQIEEKYGPTIPSKIREFYEPVRLPDEDLRKKSPSL